MCAGHAGLRLRPASTGAPEAECLRLRAAGRWGSNGGSRGRRAGLACQVVLVPLGMPAGNRWTKLAPVMMQITLMLGFYSLVADALGASAVGEMSDPEDGAPTHPLGTEPDDVGTRRKLARRQCRRAREFASAPESLRRAALWCIVGKRIMTIH